MKKHQFTIFILAIVFATTAITGKAQTCPGSAGCLDTTFGNGGITVMPAPNGPLPTNILAQTDGKILTMGRGTTNYGHKITRINPDGTPDAGFGSGGIATFVWTGNANDFAIQKVNGSEYILVAGTATITVGKKSVSGRLRIDRLRHDGSYDPSWGSNGVLAVDLNSAYGIAVQPDQKILITSSSYGTLMRLNANGTLDTTFGNSGTVNSGNGQEIRLDSSGRIYVAGIHRTGNGNNAQSYYFVRRFSQSGVLDTSFGTNGVALSRPTQTTLFAMSLDPFGNVLLAATDGSNWRVERFNSGGGADTGFSSDGYVSLDYAGGPESGSAGLDTDSMGRIIVAGNVSPTITRGATDAGVFRLNYDGSLDWTFGIGGKVGFDIAGYYDYVGSVILQTDPACACPKIVVAAGTTGGSSNQYTFARLTY